MTRNEDIETYMKLTNEYWNKVYTLMLKSTESRHVAEELAYDIFAEIYNKYRNAKGEKQLSGYIYSACMNRLRLINQTWQPATLIKSLN